MTKATEQSVSSGTASWVAMACIAALLTACAGTPAPQSKKPQSEVRIDIQQDVGFTIVEQGRISDAVRTDYDLALTSLERGDLDDGIATLEHVVATAPNLVAPRIDLGIAQHKAGDLDAAVATLRGALELNPGHPIAHNELGILYRKAGRFQEARDSYEAALAVYPGYHFARRNLAVLCDLYLADSECALVNYEAYMGTVPDDEQVSMWIADLRLRTGKGAQ